jgi:cobalt/nickel transport system permease protein
MALTLATCFVFIAKLPFAAVARRLLAANTFTIFLWLTLPLTYSSNTTATLFGVLPVSPDGIRLAGLITLKTNTVVLTLMGLLGTSRVVNLGHALESLGLPPRLCFVLLFSYRYVFVIYQEYRKLNRAAQIRCFRPSTNLHTYRTYAYMFGMTLVKSYNRAARVQQAMLLRGFNGKLIPLHNDSTNRSDLSFLMILLVLILFIALSPQFLHLT